MSYVNCGALVNGRRCASKAALRRALADTECASVTFDVTSPLGPRPNASIPASVESIGTDRLSVVGPDPYAKRSWYATVEVKNGLVKVA